MAIDPEIRVELEGKANREDVGCSLLIVCFAAMLFAYLWIPQRMANDAAVHCLAAGETEAARVILERRSTKEILLPFPWLKRIEEIGRQHGCFPEDALIDGDEEGSDGD